MTYKMNILRLRPIWVSVAFRSLLTSSMTGLYILGLMRGPSWTDQYWHDARQNTGAS